MAKLRYTSAAAAPAASTLNVSGRTSARATARPAARQPKVARNASQASVVLPRACMFTVLSSAV